MANNVNWGKIYCFTEFGDEDNTIAESIPSFSSSLCFISPKVVNQIETLAFTIDTVLRKVSNTTLKTSNTIITL